MSLPTNIDMINFSIRIRRKCISFNKDFMYRYMSNQEYAKRKGEILKEVEEYNCYAKLKNTEPFRIYSGMEKIDNNFIQKNENLRQNIIK